MAVRIEPIPDDRAERMIADPCAYFEAARRRIRVEVAEQMAAEKSERRRRLPWWRRWLAT